MTIQDILAIGMLSAITVFSVWVIVDIIIQERAFRRKLAELKKMQREIDTMRSKK